MNITRYGRVEADLNLIPVPASGIQDGGAPFAAALAAAQEAAPARTLRASDKPKVAADEPEPAPERDAKQPVVSTSTEVVPVQTAASAPPQLAPAATEAPGVTPAPRGGGSDQSDAGEGTGPLLTAKPLPAAAESLPQVAPAAGDAAVPVAAVAAAQAPVRGSGNAATPPASGITAGSAPLRTPAAVAAYRTLTPQAAQMVENARDSVFKQIMLKLGKEGGGEMRVRLEPPELGQLDVQVSVEKGGQMKLWLDAQRPELAAMLDRNLEALKQTLGQQGFTVVHAEVRDGNRSDRRRWETDDFGAGGGTGAEAELAAAPAQRQGWITANGLDFWV